MFRIALEDIKDDLVFRDVEPSTIVKRLRETERDFENKYAEIGFFHNRDNSKGIGAILRNCHKNM